MLSTARGCGFQNECGVIWFSALIAHNDCTNAIEIMNQIYLSRALREINVFDNLMFYRMQEMATYLVSCRCVRVVNIKEEGYFLVNFVIRVQCALELHHDEKDAFLRRISRTMFYFPPKVYEAGVKWLNKKKRYDFKSNADGYMIKDMRSFRMAISTLSYEVSCTALPRSIPFLRTPILFIGPCRSTVMACMSVETSTSSSTVTQPVMLRSMLKEHCDPAVWPIVSKGLCYMPINREQCVGGYETWSIHIHGEFSLTHVYCDNNCTGCRKCAHHQPISLFNLAQLKYLKTLFLHRRARVTHNTRSMFFKGC